MQSPCQPSAGRVFALCLPEEKWVGVSLRKYILQRLTDNLQSRTFLEWRLSFSVSFHRPIHCRAPSAMHVGPLLFMLTVLACGCDWRCKLRTCVSLLELSCSGKAEMLFMLSQWLAFCMAAWLAGWLPWKEWQGGEQRERVLKVACDKDGAVRPSCVAASGPCRAGDYRGMLTGV